MNIPKALVFAYVAGVWCTGAQSQPRDNLTITITHHKRGHCNGEVELFCHPTGGTHPRPTEACAKLDELAETRENFAPHNEQEICTMQYGGPQRATITGTWRGYHVNRGFDRTNGCGIREYDKFAVVLDIKGCSSFKGFKGSGH